MGTANRTRCPTPGACGTLFHDPTSAAGLRCASAARRRRPPRAPAPVAAAPASQDRPPDVGGELAPHLLGIPDLSLWAHSDLKVAAQQLDEALKRADAARGWVSDSGGPHPTGGYLSREVIAGEFAIEVDHLDADGDLHRADGAARVSIRADGRVSSAQWMQDKGFHRSDGPCEVDDTDMCVFALGGEAVVLAGGDEPCDDEATTSAFLAHLAAGATRSGALAWMRIEQVGGEDLVTCVRGASGDPELAVAAMAAGVKDREMVLAVAAGAMPLSWAIAGA